MSQPFNLEDNPPCVNCFHLLNEHDGAANCVYENCKCEEFEEGESAEELDEETAEEREEKEEKIRSVLPSKENLAKLLN